jgi:hypothetical protein
MKVEIVKSETGAPIGWNIIRESEEDDNTLAVIRNLSFFGFNDTKIMYDGFDKLNPEMEGDHGNVERIKFIQKKHII